MNLLHEGFASDFTIMHKTNRNEKGQDTHKSQHAFVYILCVGKVNKRSTDINLSIS